MCVEFTTRWYVYRDRERWHNSQEGGLVASCNEPIHCICAINFDPAYPCIMHLPLPNLSWIRTSFTNGDFTNTKALHSCMHRHTTPHGYCWGSMNERAQVLNSVPSDNGRIPVMKIQQPKPWAENVWNEQRLTKTPRTSGNTDPIPAIPSHHIIFALQTPPLDGQSGPISCAMRHATCADVGNEVSTKESWDTERGSQNLSSIKRMVLPVYKNVLLKESVGQLVQISFEKGELSDRNKQDVRTASVNSFKEAKS